MSTTEIETTQPANELVVTEVAGLTLQNVEAQMETFKQEATASIAEVKSEWMGLQADIEDADGCTAIIAAHKTCKKMKAEFEKKRKYYKTPLNVMSKLIDGTARFCIEALDEPETHLAEQRKIIDAEKLRIKEEKQRKAEAQLQDRVEKMTAVNGTLDLLQLRVMSPAKFAETLAAATTAHDKDLAEKANLQEAQFVIAKLAEYGQTATIEQILPMDAETRQVLVADAIHVHTLAEESRKKAEEEQRQQAEQQQAELAKLRAEAEERDRQEQERLKVEKAEREETQRIQDAQQAELQRLQNAEAERLREQVRQQEAEDAAEAEAERKAEAEATQKKQEAADKKAAQKKARANKKRQEELQPRRDFLNNYATHLDTLQTHTDFWMGEDNEDFAAVRTILEEAARRVLELAEHLE